MNPFADRNKDGEGLDILEVEVINAIGSKSIFRVGNEINSVVLGVIIVTKISYEKIGKGRVALVVYVNTKERIKQDIGHMPYVIIRNPVRLGYVKYYGRGN